MTGFGDSARRLQLMDSFFFALLNAMQISKIRGEGTHWELTSIIDFDYIVRLLGHLAGVQEVIMFC